MEDTQVVDTPAPVTTEAENKQEVKEEAKIKLDPSRSLNNQAKMLDSLLEDKKDESTESEEKPEDKEETPAEGKEPQNVEAETDETEEADDEDESDEIAPSDVEAPKGTWQEYVFENLKPFRVHILDAKGKPQAIDIKIPQQLPEGYSWPNAQAQDAFHLAVKAQDDNAKALQAEFEQKQQQANYQAYKNQEALDIQSDIEDLQNTGILDKFKYKENDPKFNSDPAVKIANAIYDIYEKTNEAYIKSGKTYRITYKDAADKYFAQQSRIKSTNNKEVKPENKAERDKVANVVSGGQGADPAKISKPLPRGSSLQDVLRAYNRGVI